MCMRGMYPSWIACSVIEKAPEITACEAMMVAIVDRPISGSSAQPGASR